MEENGRKIGEIGLNHKSERSGSKFSPKEEGRCGEMYHAHPAYSRKYKTVVKRQELSTSWRDEFSKAPYNHRCCEEGDRKSEEGAKWHTGEKRRRICANSILRLWWPSQWQVRSGYTVLLIANHYVRHSWVLKDLHPVCFHKQGTNSKYEHVNQFLHAFLIWNSHCVDFFFSRPSVLFLRDLMSFTALQL